MTKLRSIPVPQWSVRMVARMYAEWLDARPRRGRRPDELAAARAIVVRLRGGTWCDAAAAARFASGNAARWAAVACAERLGIADILNTYRGPVGKPGDLYEEPVVDVPGIELARDCARVVWRLSRSPTGSVAGAPADVAGKLGLAPMARAEKALRALHHARAIRFKPFERPDGRIRWSVAVPLKVRGENLNDDDKGAA